MFGGVRGQSGREVSSLQAREKQESEQETGESEVESQWREKGPDAGPGVPVWTPGCLGGKKPNISKVEVSPGRRRELSFGGQVAANHGRAVGQTERRPGTDGVGPGPGGGGAGWARARGPATQVPLSPPGPRPLGSRLFASKGVVGKGVSLSKPQARPLLRWAPPSCVRRGGAKSVIGRAGRRAPTNR